MGGVMGFLTGSNAAASQAQAYTGQAADQSSAAYDAAIKQAAAAYGTSQNQLLNSSGSPAANMFIQDQKAGIMPQFANITTGLTDNLKSLGMNKAGGVKGDNIAGLAQDQSATLAGLNAPLYKAGIGAYDSTVDAGASALSGLEASKAGGKSGIWGQGAQSASQAYTDAMNSFYSAAKQAGGSAGSSGGSGDMFQSDPGQSAYGGADFNSGSDW